MEKIRSLKYVQSELIVKYSKLLNGSPYILTFTKTDGFFLYNELENIGLKFTKEHKQKIWKSVNESVNVWYTGTNEHGPNNQQAMVEAKHRIFKTWIEGHIEKQSDIKEVLNNLIKTEAK